MVSPKSQIRLVLLYWRNFSNSLAWKLPYLNCVEWEKLKKKLVHDARPVKVNFSNAGTASHVLTQARKLAHFDKFKSVFICPDRSPEERASYKLLIEELRRRKETDPDKRHLSRQTFKKCSGPKFYSTNVGRVCSEDKSVN